MVNPSVVLGSLSVVCLMGGAFVIGGLGPALFAAGCCLGIWAVWEAGK